MPTITLAIFVLGAALLGLVVLRALLPKGEPRRPHRPGSRPARAGNWEQVDSQRRSAR